MIDFNIFITVVLAMSFVEVIKAMFAQILMDRRHNQMMEVINSGSFKDFLHGHHVEMKDTEERIRTVRDENN